MTTLRGRRLLTEAEIEIWLSVARTVAPRQGALLPQKKAKPPPEAVVPVPQEPEPRKARTLPLPSYRPPVSQPGGPAPPPLAPFEKRYRQKVSRGRVAIDDAIDLHGMTQARAHAALAAFLRTAQRDGARLVLVVTGKGRGLDGEPGVLRRAVPSWLRAADLRSVVLGFEEAAQPHGGLGALYVRLRKAPP